MTLTDSLVYFSWALWFVGTLGFIGLTIKRGKFGFYSAICIVLVFAFGLNELAQMRKSNLEKYHSDAVKVSAVDREKSRTSYTETGKIDTSENVVRFMRGRTWGDDQLFREAEIF